jgi:hypothetical protein
VVSGPDRLEQQLTSGAFNYVLVAQRVTRSIEQTIHYMNETSNGRFYAVELVEFAIPAAPKLLKDSERSRGWSSPGVNRSHGT